MRTTSSKLRHGLSLVLVYGLAVSNGPAELPPSAYRERQQNAPEVLVIKVRSVSKRETKEAKWKQTDFTVEAEVQRVDRSASKLIPGVVIQILYTQRHYSQPIAGSSEVPTLKEGQVCPAYLSGDCSRPSIKRSSLFKGKGAESAPRPSATAGWNGPCLIDGRDAKSPVRTI